MCKLPSSARLWRVERRDRYGYRRKGKWIVGRLGRLAELCQLRDKVEGGGRQVAIEVENFIQAFETSRILAVSARVLVVGALASGDGRGPVVVQFQLVSKIVQEERSATDGDVVLIRRPDVIDKAGAGRIRRTRIAVQP